MVPNLEEGEIARHKYNEVRYACVTPLAGEVHVLTSDPWSFLSSNLTRKLSGTRGNNKKNIERACYYASLAEDFYKSSDDVNLPVKGTLLYYGMLNLVKCYLALNSVPLEEKPEHHGLTLPLGVKETIQVKPILRNSVNIFSEFCKLLGKPVTKEISLKLRQSLANIPEIHGACSSGRIIKKEKFLPVEIKFLVNKNRDKLFTELSYKKKQESKINTEKLIKGDRKKYFKEGFPKEGCVVYRSKRRKSYTKKNIDRIYANILKEYANLMLFGF